MMRFPKKPIVSSLLWIYMFYLNYLIYSKSWGNNPTVEFTKTAEPEVEQTADTSTTIDTTTIDTTTEHTVTTTVPVTKAISPNQAVAESTHMKISNIPFEIWNNKSSRIHRNERNCSRFPDVFEMKFSNMYWQTLHSTNGTFYFFNAYYDNRPLNKQPSVRILAMVDRIELKVKTFCQLRFSVSEDPVVAPVLEYKYIWHRSWGNYKNGILQPYLMTCQIPSSRNGSVPIAVSITEKECDAATKNLRVVNERPERKEKFAVCVKGLDFLYEDLSVRMVEWIELLDLLGVNKIYMYELEMHPNIATVLQDYQETGKVVLTPISLPGDQPNIRGFRHLYFKTKINTKRQNEIIPYNDCLYRNLYSHDYIALIDTDEIILAKNLNSWSALVDTLKVKASATRNHAVESYQFRNVYFWHNESHADPDIPDYTYMLQHDYRSGNYTRPGHYVKSFMDVQRVLTLNNHSPLTCLSGNCHKLEVDIEDGHLQHYRSDCVGELKKVCDTIHKQQTVKDTTIWQYREQLIPRVTNVLEALGLNL